MGALSFDAAVSLGRFDFEAAFEAAGGEIVVLVGPNGAGKSTCFHLAAGLIRPARGRITLGGRTLFDSAAGIDLAPERRRVGIVFQDYALFPHRTVEANVTFGARDATKARGWLERLGLAELARELPDRLSGGQRQRVALARALAAEPAALLLDEPLGALDVSTRAAVRAELRSFLEDVRLPTVLVTHDAVDALALGSRFIVLDSGRVVQTGSREDLLRRPRNAFVADLAGRNLVHVRVEGNAVPGELRAARAGAVDFHVLADVAPGDAFVSFAPSDVSLSLERPHGSAQNVFPARVRELVPLPDRVRVVIDVGAGPALLADVTREAAARLALAPGTPAWAAVKATSIHVYR